MTAIEPWLVPHMPSGGRLAIDVGANEGSFTVMLSGRFREVHAFEPNPQVLPILRGSVVMHRNVRLFEAAVGATTGDLTLNLYLNHAHASAFEDETLDTFTRGESSESLTVPMVTLDELRYPAREVDYIKIDTEGAERAVLEGAYHVLHLTHPALLVEIHTEANRGWVPSFLEGLGYTTTLIPHPHPGVPVGHCWVAAV